MIKAKIARLCKGEDTPWLAQYPVKIKRSVARVLEVALKARGCDAFPMGDFQRRQGGQAPDPPLGSGLII